MKANKTYIGYGLIVACISLIITWITIVSSKPPSTRYDPITMCPNTGIAAIEYFLIDISDPIYATQIDYLLDLVNKRVSFLNKHEKFTVLLIDSKEYTKPEPVFDQCNPGDGEEVSNFNDNKDLRKARFKKFFMDKLFNKLKQVDFDGQLRTSPIMEMIKVATQKAGIQGFKKFRINVYSDMIQNVPAFTHYNRRDLSFQTFHNTDYADFVLPKNLNDWDIAIYYLVRREPHQIQAQGKTHINFWTDYFGQANANIVAFEKII